MVMGTVYAYVILLVKVLRTCQLYFYFKDMVTCAIHVYGPTPRNCASSYLTLISISFVLFSFRSIIPRSLSTSIQDGHDFKNSESSDSIIDLRYTKILLVLCIMSKFLIFKVWQRQLIQTKFINLSALDQRCVPT